MPIYTKTGDKGKTSLFDGTRVLKSNIRVEAYGTVDELNSLLGVVVSLLRIHQSHMPEEKKSSWKELVTCLTAIQHDLLDIGSALATPAAIPIEGMGKRITTFEELIDMMTEKMPPLKNFILPGGTQSASLLQYARTLARRAERRIVELIQNEDVDEAIVKYVNRLSDVLFTMARYVNFLENGNDTLWKKK